jgi:outer membrane protein
MRVRILPSRPDAVTHAKSPLTTLLLALVAGLPLPAGAQAPEPTVVTLEQAIRAAVERHPAAVAAHSAVSSARADRLQARGALLPNLTMNGIFANSSNQRFDQTTGQLVSESYTAQIQGTYELFGGGRRFASIRASGADVDAAEARSRAQEFQTVLQTTALFFSTAAASDLAAVAVQRRERAEQQLTFARQRLELGTATASDVLRAEIEVGNAEIAVVEAETSLRQGTLALGRQMGIESGVLPAPESLPDVAPPLPATGALVALALEGAPTVVAADATLRSRKADATAAIAPYLPTIRLSGGYDWFSYQFPPREQSWSLRLTASYPVFNGFQREAALSRARAARATAEAQARDADLAVRVSVESAVQEIGTAARRVEISDRTIQLAEEDLRVQEERYQLGVSTILDLQTSQLALADAQVAAVRARQALGTAVATLEAVLGERLTEIER